jgi:hypothetical protein
VELRLDQRRLGAPLPCSVSALAVAALLTPPGAASALRCLFVEHDQRCGVLLALAYGGSGRARRQAQPAQQAHRDPLPSLPSVRFHRWRHCPLRPRPLVVENRGKDSYMSHGLRQSLPCNARAYTVLRWCCSGSRRAPLSRRADSDSSFTANVAVMKRPSNSAPLARALVFAGCVATGQGACYGNHDE